MSLQSCPRNFIFTFVSPFIDAMIVIPYTETTIVILSLVQKNKKMARNVQQKSTG